MNELINIINEITKYELNPNLEQSDKEKDLEKNLVELYAKYFEIKYVFDKKDYADYEYVRLDKIADRMNIEPIQLLTNEKSTEFLFGCKNLYLASMIDIEYLK